jgi:hypothetical protein
MAASKLLFEWDGGGGVPQARVSGLKVPTLPPPKLHLDPTDGRRQNGEGKGFLKIQDGCQTASQGALLIIPK